MISTDEIENLLLKSMEGAEVRAEDLTGTMDHFQVTVAWEGFRGKGLIEQHRIINRALEEPLHDGRIHAPKITTYNRQ